MKVKNLLSSSKFLIAFLILLSLSIRIYSIRDHHVYFWYDQARDAIESRKILSDLDLKMQGPSASGTNDTVYHGVLYYYIIGPAYSLFENPYIVSAYLAAINSAGAVFLFLLIKDMTGSKYLAVVGSLLFAFSLESIELSTWLSNPSIGYAILPLFYLALWKLFFRGKQRWILPLSVSLGILLQAAVWAIYFVMPVLLASFYLYTTNRKVFKAMMTKGNAARFFIPLLILLSPILLTQARLFSAGIFTLDELKSASNRGSAFTLESVSVISSMYLNKIVRTIFPTFFIGSIAVFSLAVGRLIYKAEKKVLFFLLITFTSPVWLFIIQPRDSYYILIGLGLLVYMAITAALSTFPRMLSSILVITLLATFVISNFLQLQVFREKNYHSYAIQADTVLKDQLDLLDLTYEQAGGKAFSISTFTSPFRYNTTWSFLYEWYGNNRYGYKPYFVGPDQTGVHGEGLLDSSPEAEELHFTIIEPITELSPNLFADFLSNQNSDSSIVAEEYFGSVLLQTRSSKNERVLDES